MENDVACLGHILLMLLWSCRKRKPRKNSTKFGSPLKCQHRIATPTSTHAKILLPNHQLQKEDEIYSKEEEEDWSSK
jgi:hypothetical protein